MKKVVIILVCLLISSSVFAFEKGTKSFGGGFNYSSSKANSDADAVTNMNLGVYGGYFLMDNLMAKALLNYYSYSNGSEYSTYLFGAGADYFFDNIYAGAAISLDGYSNDSSHSGMYLDFNVGYLFDLVQNVYLDLAVNYTMGFGKYGGDYDSMDNEETNLNFGAGLSIFVP